jgi:hypothetical protein
VAICYHQIVLDCTWNDLEAEIVLRNLNVPVSEQERLHGYYLKLREEHRKSPSAPAPLKEEHPA